MSVRLGSAPTDESEIAWLAVGVAVIVAMLVWLLIASPTDTDPPTTTTTTHEVPYGSSRSGL